MYINLATRMPNTVLPTTGSTTQATSTVSTSSMASLQLPALPPFSLADSSTLGQRWSKWVQSLAYFLVASGITDPKQKQAVLLHLAGPEVQDVFAKLQDTGEDYAAALAKLTASPKRTFHSRGTLSGRLFKCPMSLWMPLQLAYDSW